MLDVIFQYSLAQLGIMLLMFTAWLVAVVHHGKAMQPLNTGNKILILTAYVGLAYLSGGFGRDWGQLALAAYFVLGYHGAFRKSPPSTVHAPSTSAALILLAALMICAGVF